LNAEIGDSGEKIGGIMEREGKESSKSVAEIVRVDRENKSFLLIGFGFVFFLVCTSMLFQIH
jgi:hypothetical protein